MWPLGVARVPLMFHVSYGFASISAKSSTGKLQSQRWKSSLMDEFQRVIIVLHSPNESKSEPGLFKDSILCECVYVCLCVCFIHTVVTSSFLFPSSAVLVAFYKPQFLLLSAWLETPCSAGFNSFWHSEKRVVEENKKCSFCTFIPSLRGTL